MAASVLPCVCWEWKRDDGGFSPYPPDQSAQIEAAQVSCKSSAVLNSYCVDFHMMVQRNSSSGFERAVRRTTLNVSPGTYTAAYWTWNERATNFVLYDTETSINIEASFQNADKYLDLSASSSGLPYTIDFQTLEQIRHTYNTRRKIQRHSLPPGSSLQSLLATPSSSVLSPSSFPSSNLGYSLSTSHSTTVPSRCSIPPSPKSVFGSTSPCYVGSSPLVGGYSSLSVGPSLVHNHSLTTPMATTYMYPTGATLPITTVVNSATISSPPASHTRAKIAARTKTKSKPPVISSAAGQSDSQAMTSTKNPKSKRATSTAKSGSKPSSSGTANGRQAQKSTGTVAVGAKSSRGRGGRGKGRGGRNDVLTKTGPVLITSKDDGLSAFVRKVKWLKPAKDEPCPICMNKLTEVSGFESDDDDDVSSPKLPPLNVDKLRKCGHMLHHPCLLMYIKNSGTQSGFQCPTCKKSYGIKTGDMPPGSMTVSSKSIRLSGHEGFNTIQIVYNFSPGTDNGRRYRTNGFPRTCYLPDSPKGQKVLSLLRVAWDRKLTFTIGTSVTTGATDTVVWNEIHHKTELSNYNGHGYPDPNYLDNVLMELAAQGVSEGGESEDDDDQSDVFVISSGSDDDL